MLVKNGQGKFLKGGRVQGGRKTSFKKFSALPAKPLLPNLAEAEVGQAVDEHRPFDRDARVGERVKVE